MMQIKPVSRSTGRSATAASAYRSGTVIECSRENIVHDYTKKSGIYKKDSQIIIPSGISADWAHDRNVLWNAAEHAEKRKDARVAREYIIALPQEATASERKELTIALSQYIANRYGVAVDMNLHAPHVIDGVDNGNYHAHLLTTTRVITEHGLGAKSEVELSDADRFKRGLCLSKDEVVSLRGHWADLQNQVLEKYGVHVSSLTLEAQGIDREPTLHMGPERIALERDGFATLMGNYNREIELRNLEKEYGSPLALEQEIILTEQLVQQLTDEQEAQRKADQPVAQVPMLSLEEIRARARADFAPIRDKIKADQDKAKAIEQARLMDEARAQGRMAAEAIKQQRITQMLTQLDEIAQRRREQQAGYRDDSVLWRELPHVARTVIEVTAKHGIAQVKDGLTKPSGVDTSLIQQTFDEHAATVRTLTARGTLFDMYVPPEPRHERVVDQVRQKAPEKEPERDDDYGMSM